MGLFSCSIPPSFVVSPNVPMSNTRAVWLCFGAFLSPPARSLRIHWPLPLASRSTPHTAIRTSSLLSLPEIFHPTATCPRLGQLPTQPCLQVQFPLRIVGIDGAADLHITNDPHLGCCHQLNRPTLAFLVPQHTGEDPVAMTVGREIVLLE